LASTVGVRADCTAFNPTAEKLVDPPKPLPIGKLDQRFAAGTRTVAG
jgi:hypothetical protein